MDEENRDENDFVSERNPLADRLKAKRYILSKIDNVRKKIINILPKQRDQNKVVKITNSGEQTGAWACGLQ